MATILRMPAVSANASHATLVNWSRQAGDSVRKGESLADIETEKAIIELTAECDGTLGKLLVPNGAEVEVGAAIATILAAGETEVDTVAVELQAQARQAPALNPGKRVMSSPVGRMLAKQHGIDLAQVRGSGPNGRVIKQDVQGLIDASAQGTAAEPVCNGATPYAAPVPASAHAAVGWADLPHTNMRRTIARRLTESKATVPHFYLSIDCRMDQLMSLRTQINAAWAQKISVNTFVLRAAALALREVPGVNVAWTDTALRQFHSVDIAVAVATDAGLITPILRNAAGMGLAAIATEMTALAERARNKQLRAEEFTGGSFSVSNLGMYGVDDFAAIINPPQAAILAVGAIREQAVVQDGQITVGHVMRCTLAVDHRAVDGALAGAWCSAFRRLLETPLSLLT
jgi:pyruvate dehydrogenase E2 component (dihydrolipoamide acetyltransferase)